MGEISLRHRSPYFSITWCQLILNFTIKTRLISVWNSKYFLLNNKMLRVLIALFCIIFVIGEYIPFRDVEHCGIDTALGINSADSGNECQHSGFALFRSIPEPFIDHSYRIHIVCNVAAEFRVSDEAGIERNSARSRPVPESL